jgi:hypothetical protein
MSETICPIIFNSTNLVSSTNNNVYRYTFPGSATFKNAKVAISNVQMYYSWQNINSTYANNTFQIIVPVGASTVTISLTVPSGTYSVSDLNSYIQSIFIANGYYLVDANGDFIYYLELVENSSRYAVQLNTFPVPTSLPTGWSNPGAWSLPTVGYTPQLVVPSTNFVDLLGFAAGTYPSPQQSTSYSALSTQTPQLSPVSSVVVTCSLVQNKLSNPQQLLYSFSPGGYSYGQLIQSNAYQYSWVTVPDGTYADISVSFYDQNFNQLQIIDTQLVVFLLIKM